MTNNDLENIVVQEAKKIPTILKQRLSLSDEDREVLKATAELLPNDSTFLYQNRPESLNIPKVKDIAKATNLSQSEVKQSIVHIKDLWNIPNKLPTNNHRITDEQALILTLGNNHKTRWNETIEDYNVPTIIEFNAELGIGTQYENSKAFEGQRIFREATGINEHLNAIIWQGGLIPSIMSMYSKEKMPDAILVAQNKNKKYDVSEFEKIKETIQLAQENPITKERKILTEKQVNNIKDFLVSTINTIPEAAKYSAHSGASTLLKGIDKKTPIFYPIGANDIFNMKEILDVTITGMRMVGRYAKEAEEKLPGLKNEYRNVKNSFLDQTVRQLIGEYVIGTAGTELNKLEGKELTDAIDKLFPEERKNASKEYLQFHNKVVNANKRIKTNKRSVLEADNLIDKLKGKYTSQTIKDYLEIKKIKKESKEKTETLQTKISSIEDQVLEYEAYIKAKKTEISDGHAWLTQKIAINPTEAKAMHMIVKENYRNILEIFDKELEKVLGYKPNIHYILDNEITLHIPDPADTEMHDMKTWEGDVVSGKILTSKYQMNDTKSTLKHSFGALQEYYNSQVGFRSKEKQNRPKTKEELKKLKHKGMGFSDIAVTAHGADNFKYQPKIAIAPTRIKGEYRDSPEIIHFLKVPTRHDLDKLSEFAKKGNTKSWEIKRLKKGGSTTGNTYMINEANGSTKTIFIDDRAYVKLESKFGETIRKLEKKIKKGSANKILKAKAHLQNIYQEIRTDMGLEYTLLEHDYHYGSYTMKGRPTNSDVARAGTLAVLQDYGLNGELKSTNGSEYLHGDQSWGGYISSYEGEMENRAYQEAASAFLEIGLFKEFKKRGLNKSQSRDEFIKYKNIFETQNRFNTPTFNPAKQIEEFKEERIPQMTELLENGIKAFIGSGNHWTSSTAKIDEARVVASLIDDKYKRVGLVELMAGDGGNYSFEQVVLPGGVDAIIAHKFKRGGKSSIGGIGAQALNSIEKSQIYIGGDAHHGGMTVDNGRVGVIDFGKQAVMRYVQIIGQASGCRGSVVLGYNANNYPMYSFHSYLDNVVDKLTGWDEKSKILSTCHDVIQNEIKEFELNHGDRNLKNALEVKPANDFRI